MTHKSLVFIGGLTTVIVLLAGRYSLGGWYRDTGSVTEVARVRPGISKRSPVAVPVKDKNASLRDITADLPAFSPDQPGEEAIALIERWAQRNPAEAAHWVVANLSGDAFDAELVASVFAVWAREVPHEAADYVGQIPPGRTRDAAIVATVSIWGRNDPDTAAAWTEQIPADEIKPEMYERLLLAWAESEPLSAMQWSLKLPDSLARDLAVSRFCGAMMARYPSLAMLLATSVTDKDLRIQSLRKVTSDWLGRDQVVARRALLNSGIEPETLGDLLDAVAAGAPGAGNLAPVK